MLLRDTIYHLIRHAILTCEFQPGQELREQELAERYRVSRSPIRDSLLRLEQENLMTVRPRQGYRVNPILLADVYDIFDLRLLIETACAEAAAGADDAALRALDRFRGFADGNVDGAMFSPYNTSFHRAVADLSSNKRLASVALDLIEQFERVMYVAVGTPDRATIDQACAEHEALIDALQAHEADRASRLAREHTEISQSRVLAALPLVVQSGVSVEPPINGMQNNRVTSGDADADGESMPM